MNLFRSEEHVSRWSLFDPASAEGILPLAAFHEVFSTPLFRERLAEDYVSRVPNLRGELIARLARVSGGAAFWQPRPPG